MAVIRNSKQPVWQAARWGFSSKAERNVRDLSHVSLLVFAATAVVTAILASISLSSEFGIGVSSSFMVAAVLFPVLCGWLAKERWRAKRLEQRINRKRAGSGSASKLLYGADDVPAGLIIVSPDLRICFANRAYLRGTLQESQGVLGWLIQDVLPVDGIEDRAQTLLGRSDPAASCCFETNMRTDLASEWPVHITMTRIAPWLGEDRILVVVEDLLPGSSLRSSLPVEGYVC